MEEEQGVQTKTHHEPHEHARSRTVLSIIAIMSLLVTGGIVWAWWGEKIQDACFGEGEVCTFDINRSS